MTTEELRKLSTRSFRFAHHVKTSADFTLFPQHSIELGGPSSEQAKAWGLPLELDLEYFDQEIFPIPGGRWVVAVASYWELRGRTDPFTPLLCWDLNQVAQSRDDPLLPVAFVNTALAYISISRMSVAYRKQEDDYVIVRGGTANREFVPSFLGGCWILILLN